MMYLPKDANQNVYLPVASFASKAVAEGKLFKRVHGVNAVCAAGVTGYVELVVPYPTCKFSGAEIIGGDVGDTVDFFVLDNDTNTYSGVPLDPYGPNFILNQFGFNVEMYPAGLIYSNTSNYDASLFQAMRLLCAYKNNGTADKRIAVNYELHEVKA